MKLSKDIKFDPDWEKAARKYKVSKGEKIRFSSHREIGLTKDGKYIIVGYSGDSRTGGSYDFPIEIEEEEGTIDKILAVYFDWHRLGDQFYFEVESDTGENYYLSYLLSRALGGALPPFPQVFNCSLEDGQPIPDTVRKFYL